MKNDLELKRRQARNDENHSILPLMTALFVESFEPGVRSGSGCQSPGPSHEKRVGRIFRLPLRHDASERHPHHAAFSPRMVKLFAKQHQDSRISTPPPSTVTRALISGISKSCNNLLMGILGNATLIRLQLDEKEANFDRAIRMERLIQSGSFLIHMVLGYLGEPRIEEKRMRLYQLFKEMKAEVHGQLNGNDFRELEEKLRWASSIQSPKLIAGSSARVLEVLFREIQFFSRKIAACKANRPFIQDKAHAIETLVFRGLELARELKWFAGDFKPRMTRLQIVPLVKRQLRSLNDHHFNVKADLEVMPQLPLVLADRELIEYAVQQTLTQAIQAKPSEACLSIRLRQFQEEAPGERCGVHMRSDYVVISIQHPGACIFPEIQKRIFEPFFLFPGNQAQAGLGLAAAAGILRGHRGYIQVQSVAGKGICFKIYLPLAHVAVEDHAAEELHGAGVIA